MGIILSASAQFNKPVAEPFVTKMETFATKDGKQATTIKIAQGDRFTKMNHGPRAWSTLFTSDAQGDSNLLNVFLGIHSQCESHEDAQELVDGMKHAVLQFLDWHKERYEEEAAVVTETVVEEEAPAQDEPKPVDITQADIDIYTKRLKCETKMWRTANAAEAEILVQDACDNCVVAGLPWEEYRTSLKAWATAADYLSSL